MSTDKWKWTEICDTRPCPGDCDLCDYDDEEDDTITIKYEDICV